MISAIRSAALFFAVAALAMGGAREALAQTSCANVASAATVDAAFRVDASGQQVQVDPQTIQLGDTVAVKVTNLAKLYDPACQNKVVVLFLNDMPISSLLPYPPTNPNDNVLRFVLRLTDQSKQAWASVLGRPGFSARDVKISVGFEDQFPLKATNNVLPVLHLNIIPGWWFALWGVIFVAMVAVFLISAHMSNIIRDGSPLDPDAKVSGTFSLAKTQGAWWFFVIMAAYLFIGIITGDFSNSINSTALILLGIGAGTVIGSVAIDAQKMTADEVAKENTEAASLSAAVDQSNITIANLKTQLGGGTDAAARLKLTTQLAQAQQDKTQKLSAYRKLQRTSEGFLKDILSDANGISFHRFQIFAWTFVLSIIFIKEVYANLAMPVFNTTLMGLLGLSAGTYLGLKIPEPTLPS
jgi:hypothetical protein